MVFTPVKLGIVGLGNMGRSHARNARDLGHTVAAGADVLRDARESFSKEFDATTYEDYSEMYSDAALDAVIVTTPNTFHAPAVIEALEADLDALCEKPLADTLEGAEQIADAARAAEGFCMVGFNNRFSTGAKVLTELRKTGRFGDISHIEANYIRRRGIPAVGSWFTSKELSGGGALIDIGVHAIDFALYLAGYPGVKEVSSITRNNFGTRDDYVDPDNRSENRDTTEGIFDVDDSASAFIRCTDETTISLEVAWATNREADNSFYVRGTDAGAALSLGGSDLTIYDTARDGVDHYIDEEIDGNLDPSGRKAEDKQFLEAVNTGDAPAINTVEEGLTVQRVIDAIYRSNDKGCAVEI